MTEDYATEGWWDHLPDDEEELEEMLETLKRIGAGKSFGRPVETVRTGGYL